MSDETVEVSPCPLCKKKHTYMLEVARSNSLYGSSSSNSSRIRTAKITRLFPCPEKNDFFQSTVELTEEGNEKIDSVKVVGVSGVKRNG